MKRKWEKVEETQPVASAEQEADGCVWRSMRGALCEEIRRKSVCVCEMVLEGFVTVKDPAGIIYVELSV